MEMAEDQKSLSLPLLVTNKAQIMLLLMMPKWVSSLSLLEQEPRAQEEGGRFKGTYYEMNK